MKAVTALEMAKIDGLARERYGLPSIILMENAGRISAEEILKKFRKGRTAVFCGRGNNGGDGFVCARYLEQKGIKTSVFLLSRRTEIKNRDPLTNLIILKKLGINIKEITTKKDIEKIKRNFKYDFIIDAIFGIGFKGVLPKNVTNIVDFLNNTHRLIYALDIPSGLDATTGEVHGSCITAYKTITFGLPKKGFFRKEAKPYVGRLVVKDIGLPRQLLE